MKQELPDLNKGWRRGGAWTPRTRLVASATSFAFTLLQLSFLQATPAHAEHDDIPAWMLEDKGGWVSAQQAQAMHRADHELLAFLKSLQNTQQRLTTRSASNVSALYAGGQLVTTRDASGNLLFKPTLDSNKKIQNGTLVLADGTLQVIQTGRLVRQVDIFGNELFVRADGRADYQIAADGARTDYAYELAKDGSLLRATLTTRQPNGNLVQEYDASGRLARAAHPNGRVITYTDGRISSTTIAGWSYLYSHAAQPDGTVTATLSQIRSPDGKLQPANRSFAQDSAWKLPPAHFTVDGKDAGVRMVDLNKDGLPDLIHSLYSSEGWYGGGNVQHVYMNTGKGFAQDDKWTVPGGLSHFSVNGRDSGLRIVDLNNDGLPDLIHSLYSSEGWYGGGNIQRAYLNTGKGFVQDDKWTVPGGLSHFSVDGRDSGLRIVDLNGDGKPDLLHSLYSSEGWYGGGNIQRAYLNTGKGFVRDDRWTVPGGESHFSVNGRDAGLRVVDLNGDGKPDLIHSLYSSEGWYGGGNIQRAYLNTGKGFTRDDRWVAGVGGHFSVNGRDSGLRVVDLNGDKLPDLLHSLYSSEGWYGGGNIQHAYINSGKGFTRDNRWVAGMGSHFSVDGQDAGLRILDLNADGKPDLLHSLYSSKDWYGGGNIQQAYLNTGTGFSRNAGWALPPISHFSVDGRDSGLRAADLNADGGIDFLHSVRSNIGWYGGGSIQRVVRNLSQESPTEVAYVYSATGEILSVRRKDGSTLRFSKGIPIEITAADGTVTKISASQSGPFQLAVARAGITRTYSADGSLTQVTLVDKSSLALEKEALRALKLPDGTRVTEGVYGPDSTLVSGTVHLPDGRKVRYADGKPVEANLPDGTRLDYAGGQPSKMTLATGEIYTLTHQIDAAVPANSRWIANLNVIPAKAGIDPRLREDDKFTQLIYSEDWTLQQATRADGATLTYANGRLSTLTQADGVVVSYAYDSQGRLASTVAASPDPAQPAIRSEYAYDKIRKVYKGKTLIYEYSYEFAPDGAEITVIREIPTGLVKRYRAGQLISQTDADGAVTAYEYTANPTGYTDPYDTAVGAIQTLSDGIRAHYERSADPAQPWKRVKLTRPDGTEVTASGKTADPLTPTNGVGSAPGKIGNAAQFALGKSQYLSIPDNNDLSMGNTDFTIAAWVNVTDLPSGDSYSIIHKGTMWTAEYRLLYETVSKGRFRLFMDDGQGNGNDISTPGIGAAAPGTWNFVVFWHDSKAHTMNIQLNNGSTASGGLPKGSHDSTGAFAIGRRAGADRDFLNGRVDEVGVWKKVLTPKERADLYNAGAGNTFRQNRYAFNTDSAGTLANKLVAYYNLDEPAGTRADSADLSALIAQAQLPTDRASLRRMVEQGTLKLIQPASPVIASGEAAKQSPVLARSTVTYQGKPREAFSYSYGSSNGSASHDLTYVTDSAGVTRTYDGTRRLVAIEQPDGTRYSVTLARDLSPEQRAALNSPRIKTVRYTDLTGKEQTLKLPDPDLAPLEKRTGEEVTIQHLTRRRLPDGTELHYQFGRLDRIRLPDGRVLTNFTTDQNGIPLRATLTLPNGTTKALQNGALIEVTRPKDQVKLRYRDNRIAEIHVPVNVLNNVTVSSVGLDAQGRLHAGEVLLPSEDRLTLSSGRFSGARLNDGTEVRSVTVNQDSLTGATLSVSGSTATLSSTRDVGVTLSSGQEYRYRYKLDATGNPTNTLETMTFRDDFEDGNSLGWRTTGGWSVTGGDLRGYELNNQAIYAQTGLNWADYTLTTQFTYEQLTSKASEGRLLFRYQDDNNHYFAQTIRRTSSPHEGWHLLLGGRVGGQGLEAAWIPLSGFSDSSRHTLAVEVRGSTFRIFLNGSFRGEFSDGRLSRGSVGFSVQTGVVRFHDIEVTFPGEDLRDDATRQVDAKLRTLRTAVAQATGPIGRIGTVPATFDPARVDPSTVKILEESTDPDVKAAVSAVRSAASDPSLAVLTETDAQGRRIAQTQLDGSTILYTPKDKPAALYDSTGRLLTRYAYDAQNRLSQLSMAAVREDFPQQIAVLENEIAQGRARTLRTLAEEKHVLDQQLEANATVARERLANTYQAVQDQLRALSKMNVKGKAAKQQKGEALDQIRAALHQIQSHQTQLEGQYAGGLSNLHQEVANANRRIEEDTAGALAGLRKRQEEFYRQILRQELAPVAEWVYRSGLGRTASTQELKALVDQVYQRYQNNPSASVDAAALEQELRKLPEYKTRLGQVTEIKRRVTDWLTTYLRAPPQAPKTDPQATSRRSLLASLGLIPEEAAKLTDSDAQRVLASLNAQSLHFGHSAFLTLKEFLAGQKIQADPNDLAVQAILVDILTGTLNPKTTGDLELSLFALARVARLHGGTATPVQVPFNDLKKLLASGPAIAHVNGNHYILVTGIAPDGSITYREPNQGPTGETLTMSQAAFQLIWKGFALSARAPPHPWQALTDPEAQQITGSFFGLIYIALIIIFREQIAEFLNSVAIWINDYIPSFFSVAKSLFSNLFSGWANLLQGNFKEALIQLGSVALTLAFAIINPVAFAISTILSTILNASGLDPAISALVSAFVSGGVTGGLSAAANLAANAAFTFGAAVGHGIAAGIQSLAIAGTQLGLVKAGLDPNLASLASIGVGTIANSMISGVQKIDPTTGKVVLDPKTGTPVIIKGLAGLSQTLRTSLAPTLAGELARYGIVRLGESVGLDPRISQLAGMPIKAGIGNITSPQHTSKSVLNSMWEGLKGGALQVGLSFATQGLDPFLGSLASATITGAIEGLLSPADPNRPLDPKRKGIFAGIGDTVTRALGGFTEIGLIKPGDPLATTQGLAKLNDFSTIVRKHGLGVAVETYATSLLYRSSVESLISAGNNFSIQQAINAQLQDPNNRVELEGKSVIQISLGADASGNRKYLWVDSATHSLIASLQGQDYIRYVAPPKVHEGTRTAAPTDALIERKTVDPLTGAEILTRIKLEAAGADWIEIQGSNGLAYRIDPDHLNRLRLNPDGTVKDGILTDTRSGAKFWFQNNQVVRSVEKKELWAMNPDTGKLELQPVKAIAEMTVDVDGKKHLNFRKETGEKLNIDPVRLDFAKNSYLLVDKTGNQTLYYNGFQVLLGDRTLAAVIEVFHGLRSLAPDQQPEQTVDALAKAVGRQTGGDQRQQDAATEQAKNILGDLKRSFGERLTANASLENITLDQNLVEIFQPNTKFGSLKADVEYTGSLIWHKPEDASNSVNFSESKGVAFTHRDDKDLFKVGPVSYYGFHEEAASLGGTRVPADLSVRGGTGTKMVMPSAQNGQEGLHLTFEAATEKKLSKPGKTLVVVKIKASGQYASGTAKITFEFDSQERDDETKEQRNMRSLGKFLDQLLSPAPGPQAPPPVLSNAGQLAQFLGTVAESIFRDSGVGQGARLFVQGLAAGAEALTTSQS